MKTFFCLHSRIRGRNLSVFQNIFTVTLQSRYFGAGPAKSPYRINSLLENLVAATQKDEMRGLVLSVKKSNYSLNS